MQLEDGDWPTFGWTTDMREPLARAARDREPCVLGTLVRAEGSSPRPVGSQVVLRGAAMAGYLSGGCLEADVANHAAEVLVSGVSRRLIYGVGSPWLDIRLMCGGTIEILLERVAPGEPSVTALAHFTSQRRRCWWGSDGKVRTVQSRAIRITDSSDGYVVRYDPPWRIVVIGGDPIALAVAALSSRSGFETTVLRPDGPREPPPIPDVSYLRSPVTSAIAELRLDPWTAVVCATHDDDIDDAAIVAALRAQTGYVGVLGAGPRVAARLNRLLDAGIPRQRAAALHAPIGAVRTGKAPWEVAVSVIAEIMQLRTDRGAFDVDATIPARQLPGLSGLAGR